MTDEDHAYLAGLIDTCGKLRIRKPRADDRHIELRINRLYPEQIDWLRRHFPKCRVEKLCPGTRVTVGTSQAVATIFANCYPHLQRMKPMAQIAFKFAKTVSPGGKPTSPDDRAERVRLGDELLILNADGVIA